ncbi:hypothetical protein AVEN_193532-1 [Araneus ventricosus]|uniref:Uncharacterized protein n=1 Tax=Araneus ventricosus TaxID=182803 RepID=A0A4Y2JU57_ARAVE|nr:hypothetical protein AVEN_193532-1 [Araneus ventricosus]
MECRGSEAILSQIREFNLTPRSCNLWKQFQDTIHERKPGQGRPRATTDTEDRYLSIIARRNRESFTWCREHRDWEYGSRPAASLMSPVQPKHRFLHVHMERRQGPCYHHSSPRNRPLWRRGLLWSGQASCWMATPPMSLERGTVTGEDREDLEPHVLPFRGVGPEFIFLMDEITRA